MSTASLTHKTCQVILQQVHSCEEPIGASKCACVRVGHSHRGEKQTNPRTAQYTQPCVSLVPNWQNYQREQKGREEQITVCTTMIPEKPPLNPAPVSSWMSGGSGWWKVWSVCVFLSFKAEEPNHLRYLISKIYYSLLDSNKKGNLFIHFFLKKFVLHQTMLSACPHVWGHHQVCSFAYSK